MSRALRMVFIGHGLITLAAAVVLVAAPKLIPSAVGIDFDPRGNLVSYLLGAMELGVAVLSLLASRLDDQRAVRAIAVSFAVMHLASGAVEVLALREGVGAAVWANVALRVVVAVIFLSLARRVTASRPSP